jgi:hypothetical protein
METSESHPLGRPLCGDRVPTAETTLLLAHVPPDDRRCPTARMSARSGSCLRSDTPWPTRSERPRRRGAPRQLRQAASLSARPRPAAQGAAMERPLICSARRLDSAGAIRQRGHRWPRAKGGRTARKGSMAALSRARYCSLVHAARAPRKPAELLDPGGPESEGFSAHPKSVRPPWRNCQRPIRPVAPDV